MTDAVSKESERAEEVLESFVCSVFAEKEHSLQEIFERGAFRQQSGCGCHRHGGKYALRLGDICGESIPCGGNESSRRNVITFDIKGKRGR